MGDRAASDRCRHYPAESDEAAPERGRRLNGTGWLGAATARRSNLAGSHSGGGPVDGIRAGPAFGWRDDPPFCFLIGGTGDVATAQAEFGQLTIRIALELVQH